MWFIIYKLTINFGICKVKNNEDKSIIYRREGKQRTIKIQILAPLIDRQTEKKFFIDAVLP